MTNSAELLFGLDTFGDMNNKLDGTPETAGQVIRNVVEQAVLADELGLHAFNIGEHHRDDFAVSAPDTVLAGIATRTSNIVLGTGVTVLSSEDPVRVYQRFATIDALSNGRAEITAGRGSFTESFPLFGYELSDYHVLFEEKLELLTKLLDEGPVTWSGRTRASLTNQEVYPKTEKGRIGLRVGVGGSPLRIDASVAGIVSQPSVARDALRQIDRDRERQSHEAAGPAVDLRIDAHHLAAQVEQRPARVPDRKSVV